MASRQVESAQIERGEDSDTRLNLRRGLKSCRQRGCGDGEVEGWRGVSNCKAK